MTESAASLITLSAPLASAGWYIWQSPERDIHSIVMCLISGVLCLFGGFLISGAVMKLIGPFDSPLIPALLVCTGTTLCTAGHHFYLKRKSAGQKPTN
ncbi:hypothetical protein [Neptuniibacter halophilus]|uniref:hypothetical protein n=1 Tax=Neptuniibacter halophilus TaxID=651666 RepID=UPI00257293A2|nr:hypothetical protein [Neptuniibacter halophilus]